MQPYGPLGSMLRMNHPNRALLIFMLPSSCSESRLEGTAGELFGFLHPKDSGTGTESDCTSARQRLESDASEGEPRPFSGGLHSSSSTRRTVSLHIPNVSSATRASVIHASARMGRVAHAGASKLKFHS